MGTTPTVIYSFGDSLSDAGDAWLATNSQYAQAYGASPIPVSPPYFQEAYVNGGGTVDANVFSNGPVWVQDLAVTLGIEPGGPGQLGSDPDTIQSALVANGISSLEAAGIVGILEASQHTTGYLKLVDGAGNGTDFAIGGAVTGLTGFNTNASIAITDLAAQVTNFENEITTPVANALYTVWAGANDALNLLESSDIATLVSSGAAATDMAQSASNEVAALQSLVADGATNLLVLNVPDIGKTPEVIALGSADVAIGTSLAQEFNSDLSSDLSAANFGAASVKLVDTFGLIDAAVADPTAFGLVPANISSSVYTGSFSNFDTADLVSNVPSIQDGYLFFDGLHPTSTGQTAIANLADAALACFAAGTRILTTDGEVAVEALRVGQQVVTVSGGRVPVRWLGHRHVACARHPRPRDVCPVRVAASAFGPGMPHADLLLSPDHAVFVSGVLIPIRYLVNGATVAQQPVAAITYWHVELAAHDVLLAEGLPAESYLDTGNRDAFANGDATVAAIAASYWRDDEFAAASMPRASARGA